MTKTTHLMGGTAACCALLIATPNTPAPETMTMIYGGALFGSLFPDIDTPGSKLGHLIKPVSTLIRATCGHRGLFHAPLPYMVLLAVLWLLGPVWLHPALLGFGLGVLSHMVLDAFNALGIPVLWPFGGKLSLGSISVGGFGEKIIRLVLFCGIAVCMITWIGKVV